MLFKLTDSLIKKITELFNLEEVIAPPTSIPGGKVHQVWKLQTEKTSYALKRLNIETSSPSVALYRETQKIAKIFKQNNISVITALLSNHDPIIFLGNNYFMLFDWMEGEKVSPQHATLAQARKMGQVMANMHQLRLSSDSCDTSVLNSDFYHHVFSASQWEQLVAKATQQGIKHAGKLLESLPLILKVCQQAEKSTNALKSKRIISHRDASPNNVIWQAHQSPIIIDWELAGLIHPTVDLLGGAFDWSLVRSDAVSLDRFKAFTGAYFAMNGQVDRVTDAFFGLMGIWFSWMEFNLKRFIDQKDKAQKELGEREVLHTLIAFHTVYPERERWLTMLR